MTAIAPPWLADSLPEWVRDYLAPAPDWRAQHFAGALERAARTGTVVKAESAVLAVEPLDWDTGHFGLRCARIGPVCIHRACSPGERAVVLSPLVEQALDWCRNREFRLVVRRMVAARNVEAGVFEARGFRLVDVITTLTASAEAADCSDIRPLEDHDLPAARRIVAESFTQTRFVADRLLDPAKSRDVYVQWLNGLATGAGSGEKPGDGAAVLVAQEGNDVAGLVALRRDPSQDSALGVRLASIELYAVAAAARGRGHGARLLAAAKSWARSHGAALVEASTWAAASDALRSYRGAGFEMRDTLLSFHGHLE
jgi:GNAT superfamily N-acetyltransferase